MIIKILSWFVILLPFGVVTGQTNNYSVKKTSFSTEKYDEFSPVFYKNGLVFCSNQSPVLFIKTDDNKNFFKIHYTDTTVAGGTEVFSASLNSSLNDGPASFNKSGDTIYFSRNLITEARPRNASDQRNRLGIFFAVLAGGKWKDITELRFNSDSYNITTPWLSEDGRKLFFASDKPGGFGGSDLYYCEWKNNYWNNPVNLGKVINTEGNEAYPFVSQSGELFFSSDGHPGLGRKDIFYSRFIDSAWIEPVRLNPPVNSEYDDFGLIANDEMTEGYFSSQRGKTIDIYSFKTINPQFFYCSNQKVNRYCFSFQDDLGIDIDPVNLQFSWNFGDGKTGIGYMIDHCYPGPGRYSVKQNIVERKTGKVVYNKMFYDLELKEIAQPFISSVDYAVAGREVDFDGSKSNLPGYEIISYQWDFGNGVSDVGKSVKHAFSVIGSYNVKLGLKVREIATGRNRIICVSKNIIVADTASLALSKTEVTSKESLLKVTDYENSFITLLYSSAEELSEKAVFQVELMTSKTKIKQTENIFSGLVPKYTVKEVFLEDEKLFSYVIDEGITFMDVYPAFKEAASMDFKNTRIKTYISSDPAERELWNIKRLYPAPADLFFTGSDFRILQKEFPVLDQLVIFLKKNSSVRLEIASHSDNAGLPETNLRLSQSRAQSIVNYLVSKGISPDRLKPAGYGSTRPVASNYSEADRKKNRRIDFIMLSK